MTTIATMIPGEVTFFDANGNPLAGGTVNFYQQGTTTPKNTWQDFGGTVLNANPVVLDSAGRANVWGTGLYRQVVKDSSGNTIWDQNVFAGDASSVLDTLGSTQGSVLYRAAGGWAALGPSTSGFALTTQGSNANPIWAVPSGAIINVQYFTSAGTTTYTPTVGTNAVIVEVFGGGGGSGGAPATDASHVSASSGGGGGGYARKRITSAFSGVTITVGAGGAAGASGSGNGGTGGTSSFGSLVSATGGSGGIAGSAQSTSVAAVYFGVGGMGGTGSSGDLNAAGGQGGTSVCFPAVNQYFPGMGGWTVYNEGVVSSPSGGGTLSAAPGSAYGVGARGGGNGTSQGAALAGAAGADGAVIVWEFG